MAKTVPVKLPVELVEMAKARDENRPPGEVILEMVTDYLRLERYAKAIADSEDIQVTSVSDVIIGWQDDMDRELSSFRKKLNETELMFKGMEIYFRKTNRGEDYGKRKYGKEERGRE